MVRQATNPCDSTLSILQIPFGYERRKRLVLNVAVFIGGHAEPCPAAYVAVAPPQRAVVLHPL
jgi:hypothetical protein